jgi:hypothetical protein
MDYYSKYLKYKKKYLELKGGAQFGDSLPIYFSDFDKGNKRHGYYEIGDFVQLRFMKSIEDYKNIYYIIKSYECNTKQCYKIKNIYNNIEVDKVSEDELYYITVNFKNILSNKTIYIENKYISSEFINFLEEINNIDKNIKNILNNWKELNKDDLVKINDVDIRTYFQYIILDEVLCPFVTKKRIYFTGDELADQLDRKQYYNIINTVLNDINRSIVLVVEQLNKIKTNRNLDSIIVIAPGDSPYKIVKIIQKLNLAPFCTFIDFPASSLGKINDEFIKIKMENYMKEKLPININSIVFMDFFFRGKSMKYILEIYKKKIDEKELTNTEDINTINKLLQLIKDSQYHVSKNIFLNNELVKNYFINIEGESNIFMDAEINDLRCIQKFKTYDEEELKLPFNNIRCELFIYAYIIFKLNKEKVNEILKDRTFIDNLQEQANTEHFISRQIARKIRFPNLKTMSVENLVK